MKSFAFACLAALLAACSPASSEEPKIGQRVGVLVTGADVYEFSTPSGANCIYVSGYKKGGLSCDFPK